MIYPCPKKPKKNAGSNALKKCAWKLARHKYTKKRDEALAQEKVRMATRPLMPPHKPGPGSWPFTSKKATDRYNVAVEKYKRKMKERGLEPVWWV